MKITILHPTRGRYQMCCSTIKKWMDRADDIANIEYILSTDKDDFCYEGAAFAHLPVKRVNAVNSNAVQAINRAASLSTGDILIVVSDDTDCPEHWDTLLLKELEGKSDFCAKTNDGLQPTLITMPVMDRIHYEKYGYVYFRGYFHMFCDQELTAVAIMTGTYIKLDLKFEHLHYSTGKTLKDGLNARNDSTWKQGENLFNERLKTNFGIKKPVVPYSEIKWK